MSMHRLHLKRSLGLGWRRCQGRQASRDVVLLYHAIGGGPLSTDTAMFEQQMQWLLDHAQVLPLDDLLSRPNDGRLRVALTFDDGYASLYHVAHPILQRRGFKPTVFLTSGMLDDTAQRASDPTQGHYPQESFMSWRQVNELLRAGWGVGCHGWQHIDGTKVRGEEFKVNIERCRSAIHSHTGQTAHTMAFTWGHFNQSLLNIVVGDLGMRHAFSCIHGAVQRPLHPGQAIKRIDIRPDLEMADFASIVQGDWDYLGLMQKARHLLRQRHAS